MTKASTQNNARKKVILLIILAAFFVALSLVVLEKMHITNLYTKQSATVTEDNAKTTSTAPSAQENFTDGGERPITRGEKNEGIISDTSGNISVIPSEDQWSSSNDKAITVYSPLKNSVLTDGSSITGVSNLPRVYFRLIDDVNGVIAQGTLSVSSGKFSGTFSFQTTGTNGRLDIFNATIDGVESSNVEIPVRFK